MKRKILFSLLIALLGAIYNAVFLKTLKFRLDVLSDIITFLSIAFGFYITGLAVFVSSSYVSKLYLVVDQKKPSRTLLHALTSNYRFGLTLTIGALIYFIFIQFSINASETEISLSALKYYPIIPLLVLNFGYCFFMLNDLIKIIIQEGKQERLTGTK